MNNKARLFAFLLALIMIPEMGISQSLLQNRVSTDVTKLVAKDTVKIHSGLKSDSANEMDFIPVVENSLAIYGNGTILGSIKDTINQIASNTKPKTFLFWESTKIGSWIGLLALLAGIVAAVFAGYGFWYQKKSARSLDNMENKRLPFMVFAKKIFENVLTIDIITDIEISRFTDEETIIKRKGYQVGKAIDGLHMPEDLLDVRCYEKFPDDDVYITAINVKVSWKSYNKSVDELLEYYEKNQFEDIIEKYKIIRKKTILLLHEFFKFEDLIRSQKEVSKSNDDYKGRRDFERKIDLRTEKERLEDDEYLKNPSILSKLFLYGDNEEKPDAKFEFLSQLLLDFRHGQREMKLRLERNFWSGIQDVNKVLDEKKYGIPWLSDCEIFKYDTNAFDFRLDIPMKPALRKLLDRRWKMGYGPFWDVAVRLFNINPRLNKYTKTWPQATVDLFGEIYGSYGKRVFGSSEELSERTFFYGDYYNKAWAQYEYNLMNGLPTKNSVIIRLMYNVEISIRRKSMIDDNLFLEEEGRYYVENFVRYSSFPVFIRDIARVEDLFYAIVAEQNLSFASNELSYKRMEKSSGFPVFMIIPSLEKFGIVKGDEFIIRSFSELYVAMKKDETMSWYIPIDDPAFITDVEERYKMYKENYEIMKSEVPHS